MVSYLQPYRPKCHSCHIIWKRYLAFGPRLVRAALLTRGGEAGIYHRGYKRLLLSVESGTRASTSLVSANPPPPLHAQVPGCQINSSSHLSLLSSQSRLARGREEWESAALQNANTKCNGLLPVWGPHVPESAFATCLAR